MENFGADVLCDLLPGGQPHWFEKSLWDYKLNLPTLPPPPITDSVKQQYESGMAAIIKDVVSFYNSYGGYLVIGIQDVPRVVEGFAQYFDPAELIRRIRGVTKHDIDCHYAVHEVQVGQGNKSVGLLYIPQRSAGEEPAQFLRDAVPSPNGKMAYKRNDIYFRQGDECKPAQSAADFNFLCSQERFRTADKISIHAHCVLTNNLRPRDPGFIKFIGRGDYLQRLWKWLCDPYSPVKLLSGYGGVGKTTLAREFAEDVVRSAAVGLEFVVWVSAKPKIYLPTKGRFVDSPKVDFSDVDTLLRSLLTELGHTPEMLDPQCTRLELGDKLTETLRVMPSLLIIDDIDSLVPEDQHEVFHTIVQIIDRTFGSKCAASRAILTARLDLGAAASQLVRVTGLDPTEFQEYVCVTAESIDMPWSAGANSKLMKKFHKITDGSPTFASAILRLVEMGQTIERALERWKGSDGEEVRAVAFKRELDRLSDSQVRTLYAASCLGETSLVELQTILDGSETLLKDDIGELRKYHLLATGSDIPNSGVRLIVPNSIQVMQDLIQKRVHSFHRIEERASRIRRKESKHADFDLRITRSAAAMWINGESTKAFETLSWADKQNRDQPDLKCLLGSAYLRLQPPNAKGADIEFRRAYELGCRRTELTALWVSAKMQCEDWVGILEVTRLPNRECPPGDDCLYRAEAYFKLSELAERTLRFDTAAKHCLAGGTEISDLLKSGQAQTRQNELTEWRVRLMENYLRIKDYMHRDENDHLYVWEASVDAFRMRVRRGPMIELGLCRLESWWKAVKKRENFDFKAKEKLRYHLRTIENVLLQLTKDPSVQASTIDCLKTTLTDLNQQADNYIA